MSNFIVVCANFVKSFTENLTTFPYIKIRFMISHIRGCVVDDCPNYGMILWI